MQSDLCIGTIVPVPGRPGKVYVAGYFSPMFLKLPAEVACVAACLQATKDAEVIARDG